MSLSKAGPKYVLKIFPQGYCMYDHNKGPATNPRHDPYLYGKHNFLLSFWLLNPPLKVHDL